MHTSRVALVAGFALALSLTVASAAEKAVSVKIGGVHLCCGKCEKGVVEALKKTEGITDLETNKKKGSITFEAADEKAAKAAIVALAKGGFHGEAKAGDKKLEFPKLDVEKGTKSDKFTVTGMHLCCGKCVTGAKKALADVEGIEGEPKFTAKKGMITVSGKDIDILATFAALNKAGFHGELAKE